MGRRSRPTRSTDHSRGGLTRIAIREQPRYKTRSVTSRDGITIGYRQLGSGRLARVGLTSASRMLMRKTLGTAGGISTEPGLALGTAVGVAMLQQGRK
jgi:hypothetical protein